MREGANFYEGARKLPPQEDGPLAADTHKVLMGLQRMRALREAGLDYLNPENNTPGERNEAMAAYITSGKAAEFAAEFGSAPKPEKIQAALRELGIPTKDDTLH